MSKKKIVIFGGGTLSWVRSHFAICAPAKGTTARKLKTMCEARFGDTLGVDLKLTEMALDHHPENRIVTNDDIQREIDVLIKDDVTKIIFMTAALCDFNGHVLDGGEATDSGKYEPRLASRKGDQLVSITPANKVIKSIRKTRKDIFLVGFKQTCGLTEDEQYIKGLHLCKEASCNLVFANDSQTKLCMVITPEESRYHVTTDRNAALLGLVEMAYHRSHLTFTRSTVVGANSVAWNDERVPESLRVVVDHCVERGAYKPFRGVTTGHFACKLGYNTFLTSKRRTNFNDIDKNGLVLVKTDGPDNVIAYGAKPSVGGQSQRIVFSEHPELDCIVHFHCPKKESSMVPTVSQYEFECGSHECGQNTSNGLREFTQGSSTFKAVYLEEHGPNIVFSRNANPKDICDFIDDNFDLEQKTGGFVSISERVNTPSTLDSLVKLIGD